MTLRRRPSRFTTAAGTREKLAHVVRQRIPKEILGHQIRIHIRRVATTSLVTKLQISLTLKNVLIKNKVNILFDIQTITANAHKVTRPKRHTQIKHFKPN